MRRGARVGDERVQLGDVGALHGHVLEGVDVEGADLLHDVLGDGLEGRLGLREKLVHGRVGD